MISQDTVYYGAKSLSGHDAGCIYLVIRDDGNYVYLADGRKRSSQNPKKKSKKHIQLIYIDDDSLKDKKAAGIQVRDEEIRACLKMMLSK